MGARSSAGGMRERPTDDMADSFMGDEVWSIAAPSLGFPDRDER